ncbi:hypothetical protein B0H13DRAFT_1885626 [Mycena leptocephala]|nr:hypothetical protein B0H13DRAFT_1885626 [Mycena leptocephala]
MPRVDKPKGPRKSLKQSARLPPSPPLPIRCPEDGCAWSFSRPYELRRHSLTHLPPDERDALMHNCPWPNCQHRTLQKRNIITHYRTHSGDKPEFCPDCNYTTGDPASLTTHRKSKHGYIPRSEPPNRENHATIPVPILRGNAYPSQSASPTQSPPPSVPSSSRPTSVYSQLSAQSWDTRSSSSFDAPSPAYPSGYGGQYAEPSDNFTHGSSASTSSWSGDIVFDTATGMDMVLPFLDACALPPHGYGLVPPTDRPGPAGLYPAQTLHLFQLAPVAPTISDAELSALLAEAAGLDTTGLLDAQCDANVAYFTPSGPPCTIDWDALSAADHRAAARVLELDLPAPRAAFSFQLQPGAYYHAERKNIFASEWTDVVHP